ncbi:MAG: UDP-glucose/GDP-mannose dehydrogenase family protein, partial [Proteobacteria bacterium]|nr:UDP-glucose/GDP-mannose dehydrogenase family protein [Pseudomonadota bacterium]
MQLCVIGSGYVGLVAGACFAETGNDVSMVDVVASKIEMLKGGELPIYEPGLKEIVDRNVNAGRLSFTTNIDEGVDEADVVFLAVGTPSSPDGTVDMQWIDAAAEQVGRAIKKYTVIVTKSTV